MLHLNTPYTIPIILAITMVLFILNYWRYDITALLALASCTLLGVIPFHEVYSGLNNSAVITVASVMIISKAITRSGILRPLIRKIVNLHHSSYLQTGSLIMITAGLSAFMNNVGALTLMMPVAIQSFIQSKRSPSLILLPLALAAALGGLVTMLGTPPNLLIANYREQIHGQAFKIFAYTPVGVAIAIVGILFITLLARYLLPKNRKASVSTENLLQIEDYITEVKISTNSPFIGKTIHELENTVKVDFTVLGIIHNQNKRLLVSPKRILNANDLLIIEATHNALQEVIEIAKFDLAGQHDTVATELLSSPDVDLLEAVVAPGSTLENRSAKASKLRERYRIHLIAIARAGTPFKQRLNDMKLNAGDVVLLQGPAEGLTENITTLGLLPLLERDLQVGKMKRPWLPIGIFAIAIMLASLQWLPPAIAFSGAVLAMILTHSFPARLLYKSIDWPIIILLAAMIPVGHALQTTGGTALITHALTLLTQHQPAVIVLALLMLITMTLSDFINNAATAVIIAPIAVSIAQSLQVNVDTFLMAVAVSASCSFLTPFGHQSNTLVMGPGGYHFSDYIRIGFPLEVLVLLVSLPMLLWIWPL